MEDICLYLSQGQDPTRLIALSNNNANFSFFSIFCAVPVVFTLDCNMFFCLYSSFHATHYTTLQLFVTYFCAFISGVNSRTHYQNVIQKLPHNLAEELAKCFCQWHRSWWILLWMWLTYCNVFGSTSGLSRKHYLHVQWAKHWRS